MSNNNRISAIFIQNFFRFGGSFLYDQFIENNNLIGFYEPFHEDLSNYKKINKDKENFNIIKKNLKHQNKQFYFENYPFNENWFKDFHKQNNQSKIFFITNNNYKIYKNYLENLIAYGSSKSLLPIFKINRLYFNPEILEIINTVKIFLFRKPISSFFSNIHLNLLNPYYVKIRYLAENDIQPFKNLWEIICLNNLKKIQRIKNNFNFVNEQQIKIHYSVFFFIWIFGLYQNFKSDFLFINYDDLYNKEYSNNISKKIFKKTSIQINFSQFKKINNSLYETNIEIDEKILSLIKNSINYNELKEILKKNSYNKILNYLP